MNIQEEIYILWSSMMLAIEYVAVEAPCMTKVNSKRMTLLKGYAG